MADTFDTAAESLAPSRPTTRFFNPSKESVTSRYANARGTLDSAREVSKSARSLDRDRWARVAEARERKMWGREDEEYAARKSFEATRGRSLLEFAAVKSRNKDWPALRAEILATTPAELMKDPAWKALFQGHDAEYADWDADEGAKVSAEAAGKKAQQDLDNKYALEAVELGADEELVKEHLSVHDTFALVSLVGELRKAGKAPAQTESYKKVRNLMEGVYDRDAAQQALLERFAKDFPSEDPTIDNVALYMPDAYKALDDPDPGKFAAEVTRQSREEFVKAGKTAADRKRRGALHDHSVNVVGQEALLTPEERLPLDDRMRARGDVNPQPEPTPAPTAPAKNIQTVNGVAYEIIDGKAYLVEP